MLRDAADKEGQEDQANKGSDVRKGKSSSKRKEGKTKKGKREKKRSKGKRSPSPIMVDPQMGLCVMCGRKPCLMPKTCAERQNRGVHRPPWRNADLFTWRNRQAERQAELERCAKSSYVLGESSTSSSCPTGHGMVDCFGNER